MLGLRSHLEPDNNRGGEVQFPGGSDDSFGNNIATHDATEDVHKKGVHFGISSDDLESLFHLEKIKYTVDFHRCETRPLLIK